MLRSQLVGLVEGGGAGNECHLSFRMQMTINLSVGRFQTALEAVGMLRCSCCSDDYFHLC